jgi:hypothetical protein
MQLFEGERMMAHLKSITMILAVAGLSASAFAATPPTVFEDFSNNTDSYWLGVNNRGPSTDNFGWSNSDNTGNTVNAPSHAASGGGELGGTMHRGSAAAQYGFDIGSITSSDVLHADGVYRFGGAARSQVYFGFYNSVTHGTSSGDPRNFIGIELEDLHNVLIFLANGISSNRENLSPAQSLPADRTVQWAMDYDGAGKLVVTVDGVTLTDNPGSGYFFAPVTLDRFGVFPSAFGDSEGTGYWDDITFSSLNAIPTPEPASLGALAIGGLALVRRRRRMA